GVVPKFVVELRCRARVEHRGRRKPGSSRLANARHDGRAHVRRGLYVHDADIAEGVPANRGLVGPYARTSVEPPDSASQGTPFGNPLVCALYHRTTALPKADPVWQNQSEPSYQKALPCAVGDQVFTL